MKKLSILFVIVIMVFGLTSQSYADLTVVGTDSLGNQLIYDSALDVTWYDYTYYGSAGQGGDYGNWTSAVEWASGLTVGGVTGWRLPQGTSCKWC